MASRDVSNQHRLETKDESVVLVCGRSGLRLFHPEGEPDEACTPTLWGKDCFHTQFFPFTVPKKEVLEIIGAVVHSH